MKNGDATIFYFRRSSSHVVVARSQERKERQLSCVMLFDDLSDGDISLSFTLSSFHFPLYFQYCNAVPIQFLI